jgi:hypothetical protein
MCFEQKQKFIMYILLIVLIISTIVATRKILLDLDNYELKEDRKMLEDFVAHGKYIEKFGCGTPQRVVKNASDFFDNRHNYLIYPLQTVIFRCTRSCGYCKKKSRKCQREESNTTQVVFQVLEPDSKERGKFKTRRFYKVKLQNHTKCACK